MGKGLNFLFSPTVAAVAKKKRSKKPKNNRPAPNKAKETNDNNSARGR